MRPVTQTAGGAGIEAGAVASAEQGRAVGALDTRIARFDAAADCAAYSATFATWQANVAADRLSFTHFASRARLVRLRLHTSDGQTTAPFVLVVVNAADDAQADRALASAFFAQGAELTGGGLSQFGAVNVVMLSKDNPEDVLEVEGVERIDAVAVYGGTAAGAAALEVNVC